jgi:hypothetical protein
MADPALSWNEDTEDGAVLSDSRLERETLASPRVSTLLNLVQTVQEHARSDEEVVAVIVHLLRTRQVVLGGIFAGREIQITV